MARVSRKAQITNVVEAAPVERIYNTALYVRLSMEDSGTNSSEVIEMQKYLVTQYVNAQRDMQIYSIYCDNGFTGTNFERPQFEKMMEDVRARKVDCIVVKDLSRFGRNYVEAGYFLEKIFPILGVRFVAISDNYDTLYGSSGDDMVVSVKNIVNSLFAKDISKKSATALHEKQRRGEYIGGLPPYGYRKDPQNKNKLLIDEETAPVVREIFRMRLKHMGYVAIARALNEKDIPNPWRYHYLKGKYQVKEPTDTLQLWRDVSVKAITNNLVYMGTMAQGKQRQSLCDGIPRTYMKEKDWIVVAGTHEPIIQETVFLQVQEINKAVSKKYRENYGKHTSKPNILKGLMFCGDCHKPMLRHYDEIKGGEPQYRFLCRTFKDNKESSGCTQKSVKEDDLLALILKSLQIQIALMNSKESLFQRSKNNLQFKARQKEIEKVLAEMEREQAKNLSRRSSLFENYNDKLITRREYKNLKETYTKQAEELSGRQKKLLQEKQAQMTALSVQSNWIKTLHKHKDITVLTREIVIELIDQIIIEDYNCVHIHWNYKEVGFSMLESAEVVH